MSSVPREESDEKNDDDRDVDDDDGAAVAVDGGLQGLQLGLEAIYCDRHAHTHTPSIAFRHTPS